MQWSPQQDDALRAASHWLKHSSAQVFRLFGWAGTGKSTLARHLAEEVNEVCYAAYTGKAALVMRKNGCVGATTIHSLIYRLDRDNAITRAGGDPVWELNQESPVKDADLVVIDEVSMVDATVAMDLLSFGKKVLVLGDPFQLPPVKGAGFFTVAEPDIMLTDIHRQARGNPIIQMSVDIREGRGLDYGTYGSSRVIGRQQVNAQDVLSADQVVVGTNRSRRTYNDRIRTLKGRQHKARAEIGDKVVCLRNYHQMGLLNGMLFNVDEVAPGFKLTDFSMVLSPEDAGKRQAKATVKTSELFFQDRGDELTWQQKKRYQEFTFGYALTCHKSQGSQWGSVYLFDESFVAREEPARWLYTGVTRAAERVTVVL